MLQILTYVFGGLTALLFIGMVGLGIHTYNTNQENEDLREQVRERDVNIANRERLINEFRAKLSVFEELVKSHKNIKVRNEERIQELKRQTEELIAAKVIDQDKINDLENKYADLQAQLVLDSAAGNGVSTSPSLPNMEKCYYSVAILDTALRQNLKKLFPQVQEHGLPMVNAISRSQSFAVLPSVVSCLVNHDNTFKQNITDAINSGVSKIFIPYLDNNKQHWVFIEMQVDKNTDQLIVDAILHDPRGGGQLSAEQKHSFETLLGAIAGNNLLSFRTYPSNYLTVRQSLPDRISCGPIVVNEILQLAQNKTLDRSIPYGFGATEIMQEQCQIGNYDTQQLSASRYQFLNNLQPNKRGYQYLQGRSEQTSNQQAIAKL